MHTKRRYKIDNTRQVINERGSAIGVNTMSWRSAKACTAARVYGLQLQDLRAKASTDKAESADDIRRAQHMTERYVRNRRGTMVTPTRWELRNRPGNCGMKNGSRSCRKSLVRRWATKTH